MIREVVIGTLLKEYFKSIFLFFTFLIFSGLFAQNAHADVITLQVTDGADDAEESGGVDNGSSDLELTNDGNDQVIGIRYNIVNIPQGSQISNAYIQFKVDEESVDPTNLIIQAELSPNSSTILEQDGNISERPRTINSVTWIPNEWPNVGEVGPDQASPDISSLIQEVIDQSGWVEGNSLTIIITGTGRRTAESFDGDPDGAPKLIIDFAPFKVMPLARPIYNAPAVKPEDQYLSQARDLHLRLAGVTFPMDHPTIQAIADDIKNGQLQNAAAKVTEDPDFFNITLAQMGARISDEGDSTKVELNDTIATLIGVAYNEMDARLLLTGDFVFQANPNKVPIEIPSDIEGRYKSNSHYVTLASIPQINLGDTLMSVPQQIVDSNNSLRLNPDTAGVLTTRAYTRSTLLMGTNRRFVYRTMRNFMCGDLSISGSDKPLINIRNGNIPDYRIGKDVTRAPGGIVGTFKTECRTCHAAMDGVRSSTAKFNYFALDDDNVRGFLKYSPFFPATPAGEDESEFDIEKDQNDVVSKMNQNSSITPLGFTVTSDNFVNFWASNPFYGFNENVDDNGYTRGTGVSQFADQLANSNRFAECMAKRAFYEVCKRNAVDGEQGLIDSATSSFINSGYNLKILFQSVAILPNCVGL